MGKPIVDHVQWYSTLPMQCISDTTETILERKPWISWLGRDINRATNAYLNGRNIPRGPHYPVPAIPFAVLIKPREVTLWNGSSSDGYARLVKWLA